MPFKPKTHQPLQSAPTRESSGRRGYDWRSRKCSKAFLALNYLCAECDRAGRLTQAEVVDHIDPHRGDKEKFWDQANWQSLCKNCHNSKTGKGR